QIIRHRVGLDGRRFTSRATRYFGCYLQGIYSHGPFHRNNPGSPPCLSHKMPENYEITARAEEPFPKNAIIPGVCMLCQCRKMRKTAYLYLYGGCQPATAVGKFGSSGPAR